MQFKVKCHKAVTEEHKGKSLECRYMRSKKCVEYVTLTKPARKEGGRSVRYRMSREVLQEVL